MPHPFDPIFNPRSVAVIGASTRAGSIGNQVMLNLINDGFPGPIYPIHPAAPEIMGRAAYKSVKDVPGDIDIAVFCVPEKLVLDCARECAQKGVKGYVVITSGFAEVGNRKAEEELVRIAREAGGRVIGPNIVGVLMNPAKCNASFAPVLPYPGGAALLSQSGALLIGLDGETFVRQLGCSSMISLGNMADIDFADCFEFYAQDPNTTCISAYIEGVRDGRRFIEMGRQANKPIIALKAGVSAHGAAAAASHTGSLAGAAKIYDAAFKQAHVVRAQDLNDLLDRSQAMSMQPPLKGDNIVIVTNGGGIGVLGSDAAEHHGVPLKPCPPDLQQEFRKYMPDYGSAKNPVDITGGAGIPGYEGAIEAALKADWCNGVAIFYCQTAVTKPPEVAAAAIKVVKNSGVKDKPVIACFVGGVECQQARKLFLDANIPMFDCPDKAFSAFAALRQVARYNEEGHEPFVPAPVDQAAARRIIAAARAQGRAALTEPEAKEVFTAYGLPVGVSKLAKTEDEAVRHAADIGYPVVLKIVSPQILHKSDAGGVKVNLRNEEEVRRWFNTILDNAKKYNAKADIHGVLVCEMAPQGREVIVGSTTDPAFGPSVMFGLGGIFVEVLKDVTFRVAPVGAKEAMRMLPEIKAYQILQGTRGEKRLDQERLAEVISRISQMVHELGDEIAETDANPVLLYEEGKGLKVVDARIILKKKA